MQQYRITTNGNKYRIQKFVGMWSTMMSDIRYGRFSIGTGFPIEVDTIEEAQDLIDQWQGKKEEIKNPFVPI